MNTYTKKEWKLISNLKSLYCKCGTECVCTVHKWVCSHGFNAFLTRLPWWTLDNPLTQDCLLYQSDSRGLLLLCLMHVRRIRTTARHMTILYQTDRRHARLYTHHLPLTVCSRTGLMSVRQFDPSFSAAAACAD